MEEKLRQEYDNLVAANSEVLKIFKPISSKKGIWKGILTGVWIMFVGIPIVVTLVFSAIIFMSFFIGELLTTLVVIIAWYIFCKRTFNNTNNIKKKYVENILKPLVLQLKFIDEINLNLKISQEIYEKANFRQKKYEKYKGNNYLAGRIENAKLEMSNIWTTVINEYRDSTNGFYEKYETIKFEGFLITATLEKDILNGYIHIFDDKDDSNIFKIDIPETKVNMDYSLFEKQFDVYATDPIKAMEILTSDIMQILIDEKEKIGYKYDITITENKLIMRIFNGGNVLQIRGKNKSAYPYNEELRDNIIADIRFIEEISSFINDIVNDIYSKQ